MSPTAKAIAYGVVSLAVFALAFWWAYAATTRPAPGCHASEDAPADKHAPTLGDALGDLRASDLPVLWAMLRGWLRDWWDWDAPAWLWYPGDAIARWHPWRSLQLRRWARELRVPAAASAPGEGTSPSTPGEVPPELCDRGPDHPPWITAGQPRLPEMRP